MSAFSIPSCWVAVVQIAAIHLPATINHAFFSCVPPGVAFKICTEALVLHFSVAAPPTNFKRAALVKLLRAQAHLRGGTCITAGFGVHIFETLEVCLDLVAPRAAASGKFPVSRAIHVCLYSARALLGLYYLNIRRRCGAVR
jgi:hypothetical protein